MFSFSLGVWRGFGRTCLSFSPLSSSALWLLWLLLSNFSSRSVESSSEVAPLSSDSHPAYCCPFLILVILKLVFLKQRHLTESLPCSVPSSVLQNGHRSPYCGLANQLSTTWPSLRSSVSVTPLISSGPATPGCSQVSDT